ncbi:MAG TPA: hypothetical protein VMR76_02315 [Candidatus Saccharimonadia bacterium]|nr:hypothetical protein [Candidatus Saccharimonadia bacterium]
MERPSSSNKKESGNFKLPELELPSPQDVNIVGEYDTGIGLEEVRQTAEQANANTFPKQQTPISRDPISDDNTPIQQDDDTQIQISTPPSTTKKIEVISDILMASDRDLIERTWVDKAKKIVERTKQDPYRKNNELNIVKNEYKTARFKKVINKI